MLIAAASKKRADWFVCNSKLVVLSVSRQCVVISWKPFDSTQNGIPNVLVRIVCPIHVLLKCLKDFDIILSLVISNRWIPFQIKVKVDYYITDSTITFTPTFRFRVRIKQVPLLIYYELLNNFLGVNLKIAYLAHILICTRSRA